MERTALDSSVVIPALLTWHEHHERALAVVVAARSAASGAILPLPALIESFAVMTRLPPPMRLAPTVAWTLLEAAFAQHTTIAALDGAAAWSMLAALPQIGVSGGATFDAHVLACAKQAGAVRLATFNLKDFQRLDLEGLELLLP